MNDNILVVPFFMMAIALILLVVVTPTTSEIEGRVKRERQEAYEQGYEEGALSATKKEYECTLERMPDWTTDWVCREASSSKTVAKKEETNGQ